MNTTPPHRCTRLFPESETRFMRGARHRYLAAFAGVVCLLVTGGCSHILLPRSQTIVPHIGRVLESDTLKPIVGATVEIVGAPGTKTLTDRNGVYKTNTVTRRCSGSIRNSRTVLHVASIGHYSQNVDWNLDSDPLTGITAYIDFSKRFTGDICLRPMSKQGAIWERYLKQKNALIPYNAFFGPPTQREFDKFRRKQLEAEFGSDAVRRIYSGPGSTY